MILVIPVPFISSFSSRLFPLVNESLPTPLVMVNFGCQLDWIQKHLVDTSLGVIDSFNCQPNTVQSPLGIEFSCSVGTWYMSVRGVS